jgi:FtsP/CotA-like multicopper oxidase with cupredoxin domain
LIPVTEYRLAVAGRVEFLVQAPASTVKVAQLITNNINTGPQGDCDPTRPVFNISTASFGPAVATAANHQSTSDSRLPASTHLETGLRRFGGIRNEQVTATRTFQFSEIQPTQFFITQVGQTPTLFDNNNPPAVITTQGSVEHWNVQNIAQENHEFHQHQIHFLVLSQDNYETNGNPHNKAMDNQFADMIEVPYWDNVANPNGPVPQAELLMDFRGPDIGDFVYHCHILSHEDLGMMAIERVCPSTGCR